MGYEAEANSLPPGVWRELNTLVAEVQQARAAVAAAQAHEIAVLARAVDLVQARTGERRAQGMVFGNDLPLREVSAELGTAMRVGDRTVQRRIDDAHTLVHRFAATFHAWQAGRIDRQHAMTIVDEGVVLVEEGARKEYETLVLAVAQVESAGRLREIARVIAARIDPEASARRRKAALRGRDVRAIDLDDGMSRVLADLPSPLVHGIMDRLNQYAGTADDAQRQQRDAHGPDDDTEQKADPEALRTRGEIRADVFADLLLTSTPTGHHDGDGNALTGIHGQVNITIPLTTAAGIDQEPALLSGYGPIDTDLARCLMAQAPAWNLVLVNTSTGAPVTVTRYRPSAELQRFVDLRDERCRFPGCTMKPWRCDADHTIDAAHGGHTSAANLAVLCRRHHILKHASPWQVEQTGNGRLQWTSPTGRVYTDHIPATLRFVPAPEPVHDGDPPPF